MPTEITPLAACQNMNLTIDQALTEKVAPACCSEGCVVYPGAKCEHGFESVPVAWERFNTALEIARQYFLGGQV